jgi:hypothetical protein
MDAVKENMDTDHKNVDNGYNGITRKRYNFIPQTESGALASRSYPHGDLRHALIEAGLKLLTEEQDWNFRLAKWPAAPG